MKLNRNAVVATAVIAAMGGVAANASDLSGTTGDVYQQQYMSKQTAINAVALPDVVVDFDADYTLNDLVKITVNGAAVSAASAAASTWTCDDVNVGVAGGDMVISYLTFNATTNMVTYRVTQKENVDIGATGVTCTLTGLETTNGALAALGLTAAVDVDFLATSNGSNLDFDAGSFSDLVTLNDQFTSSVTTVANAVIDVNTERLDFTPVAADTIVVTTVNDTGANNAGADATLDSVSITVTGDFAWVNTDDDATCEAGEYAAYVAVNNGYTLTGAADCTSVTLSDSTGPAVGATTLTLDPNGTTNQAISLQSFTAAVDFGWTSGTAGTETDAAVTAGSWTLNGASVFIPYMPYGTGISQIIYSSNTGGQTGEATVDWQDNLGNDGSFSIGNVGPGVTQLSGLIATGLTNAGAGSKVSMTITFNLPAAAVQVYSAYNVNGTDRGTVVNDSNGKP